MQIMVQTVISCNILINTNRLVANQIIFMVQCIFAIRVVANSKENNLRGNQLVSSEIDHRRHLFRYFLLRGWPRRGVHVAHLPHVEAVAATSTSLPSVPD